MAVYTDGLYEIVEFPEESAAWVYLRGSTVEDGVGFYASNILASWSIAKPVSAADSVGASDAASQYFYANKALTEALSLPDTLSAFGSYRPVVADVLHVADTSSIGYVRTLSEEFEIAPSLVVIRGLAVIESLGISPDIISRRLMKMSVVEALGFIDRLLRFFSADVVEALSVTVDEQLLRRTQSLAAESIDITETAERTLLLRVTAPESLAIDDVSLQQMFFDASLADLLEIAAMYVAPNDSFTVWNVNALTGSVSQYDNYAFNSFAHFGQMYIGADENGLYELNGCNDEGEAIVARIKSGLAQLTASRFTMVRDAYMGIRSDGTFILRVTTGEGHTYDYKFDAENMKTTRVPLGKGMRTRYMSFELISAGSDFDLESVEFIPLMSSRRV